MAEADDAHRREFAARAPELRAAAVAELSALIEKAASALGDDQAAVLRHVAVHAGYSLEGRLYLPEFSALWGGAGESYFPPAPLPAERAQAAAHFLRRRGVLRPEGHGVFVDVEVLRGLSDSESP